MKYQRSIYLCVVLSLLLMQCAPGEDTTPPVFSVPPVNISLPYDPITQTCGDVKSVIPFGGELSPGRFSPLIEYYTVVDAEVKAVCSGVVTTLYQNPGQSDYEMFVRTSSNSVWYIVYDHILEPAVAEDDFISTGQILGKAGEWDVDTRRVELGINNQEGDEISLCPLQFGTDDFVQKHEALFQELYDNGIITDSSVCLADEVVP